MIPPFVSCIMPTANREKFIPLAIDYFLQQDYPGAELIIVDDGRRPVKDLIPNHPLIAYYHTKPFKSIGLKRNYACSKAMGQIIIHWDDDDWRAPNWINAEVTYLVESGADVCGIQNVHYFSIIENKLFTVIRQYEGMPDPMDWVHGATLTYWKSFWDKHPFKDLNAGEDDDFIQHSGAKICIHQYIDGFVSLLHPHNTIIREFENPKWKKKYTYEK